MSAEHVAEGAQSSLELSLDRRVAQAQAHYVARKPGSEELAALKGGLAGEPEKGDGR